MSERVAIIGSRPTYTHAAERVIDGASRGRRIAVYDYVASLPSDAVVVSGGANGVDSWATDAAASNRLAWKEHSPTKYLPTDRWWSRAEFAAACHRRNQDIVDDCDRMVAFVAGNRGTPLTKGSASAISKARAAGKPVRVFRDDGEEA